MTLHCIRLLFALPMLLLAISSSAQEVVSHRIFNNKGGKTTERKMLREMVKADVVLFGEQHNSTLAHWLQLKAAKHLHASGGVTIGMEMIEADDQQHLDAFLSGKIDAKALDTLARLWNNHATDYAPIVDFAKANGIRVLATNIPRRYASMVYRKGFGVLDTLPENEKAWMAPLPIDYDPELPGYKAMLEMMGGHGGETLPMAQAIKDATMAHFTIMNLEDGKTFLHLNGAYHSDRYEGILWYLRRKRPELRYLTISTVTQADLGRLEEEHRGKADFIICVDEDFPVSYR